MQKLVGSSERESDSNHLLIRDRDLKRDSKDGRLVSRMERMEGIEWKASRPKDFVAFSPQGIALQCRLGETLGNTKVKHKKRDS